jgi:hypothetical protein
MPLVRRPTKAAHGHAVAIVVSVRSAIDRIPIKFNRHKAVLVRLRQIGNVANGWDAGLGKRRRLLVR